MKFRYAAYDKSGKECVDVIDCADATEAIEQLRRQGLYVTNVEAASGSATATNTSDASSRKVKGKKLKHLVTFTRQLQVLIASGMPLVQALQALERQAKDPKWKKVVEDLRTRVEEGSSLSEAMDADPDSFDTITRSLVAAGEQSGKLEQLMDRVARLIRKQQHIRSSVRGAMVYPCLLIGISVIVLNILLVFVLPRFTGLFDQLDTPLPPTTKIVMAASNAVRGYWWLIGLVILGAVFGVRAWMGSPNGRRTIDRVVVRLPMFGPIVRAFITARIVRLLGVQIDSYVPLLEALRLTRMSAGNLEYAELIARAEDAATRGQPVSSAFMDTWLIEPSVAEAMNSGEQTGKVSELLLNVADFLDEENEVVVRSLTSIIEPVILIVLGVMVGFVALSMFLPLFDLTAAAQGG